MRSRDGDASGTIDEERPPKSSLGPLGIGFGVAGICVALAVVAFCVFTYWLANHFVDGID